MRPRWAHPRASALFHLQLRPDRIEPRVLGPLKTQVLGRRIRLPAGITQLECLGQGFPYRRQFALHGLNRRKVNRYHRIEFEELRRYQSAQQQDSEQALQDLTQLSEDLVLAF